MILSQRSRSSTVERKGDWVYKCQPKHLADNEIYALRAMYPSGYVPFAEQVNIETIRMEYLHAAPVADTAAFMAHYEPLLSAMEQAGLRHGDLTEYAVFAVDSKPLVIDWAESRLWDDPRRDKRPEGDRYWLQMTMRKLCEK